MANASGKKVGVLIFTRIRPGFDQEWSKAIRERCLKAFDALGWEPVGADAPVYDEQTVRATLSVIHQNACEALIVIQPSMADGQFSFSIMQRWAGPVVLWVTPERPGDGKVSSCSLVGGHLFAANLRLSERPFELVYGDGEDAALQADLARAVSLVTTVKQLGRSKVGVVGTHAPGFMDMAADPFLIRKTIGVQMHSLSLVQFIDRVKSVDAERVCQDIRKFRGSGLTAASGSQYPLTDENLETSSRYYLAMADLMEESQLDALALQCWPELGAAFRCWPYLAISRLATEGKSIAVEGDVDAAMQELMNHRLGLGAGFQTDWLEHDDDSILFWHAGALSFDLCYPIGSEHGPTVAAHFNGKIPYVVDGPLKADQPVTAARLWRCDGSYHMTAFEGVALPPSRRLEGNTLHMKVDGGGVRRWFDDMIHEGMPHHVTLTQGRSADTFRRLARMLGVAWH
ncbi:MAG: hypothetical protein FWD64_11555 [Acidobacteriaceae bacterium]|nr:hypothetical protein [Acidobacteriaceae bacterium]